MRVAVLTRGGRKPLTINGRVFYVAVVIEDLDELEELFKGGFGRGPIDASQIITNHARVYVSELAPQMPAPARGASTAAAQT